MSPQDEEIGALEDEADVDAREAPAMVRAALADGRDRDLDLVLALAARPELDVDLAAGTSADEIAALLDRLAARARGDDDAVAQSMSKALAGLWRWGAAQARNGDGKRAFLCALIDDDAQQRATRGDAAILLLQMGDPESLRALAARASLDVVHPDISARALLTLDPVEAYVELSPYYRSGGVWRRRLAALLDAHADPRWIDEAVAIAADDRKNATRTLQSIGTARALEELAQWGDAL